MAVPELGRLTSGSASGLKTTIWMADDARVGSEPMLDGIVIALRFETYTSRGGK